MKMKVEAIVNASPILVAMKTRETKTYPLQQTIQLSQKIMSILVTKIMILPDGIAQVGISDGRSSEVICFLFFASR